MERNTALTKYRCSVLLGECSVSASHCVNNTYIAGYAPVSLFGADVRPAGTSVAKGLKSNDFRTGASLPRRRTLRERFGRYSAWCAAKLRGAGYANSLGS